MISSFRLTILALGAAGLSACASVPYFGDGEAVGGGANYAAGSPLAPALTNADAQRLETAFLSAIETGDPQSWRGARAAGAVTPAGWALANLKADPAQRIASKRSDLDLTPVMETDLGLYVLTRNSNVRLGPGTQHGVAERLPSGSGVDVVGKVADGDWMLVAADGAVRGYVYRNLMIKAPGTELELAGGPKRRAALCREFVQRLSVGARQDQWRGAACRTDDGEWRLAAPDIREDENAPALLLGE